MTTTMARGRTSRTMYQRPAGSSRSAVSSPVRGARGGRTDGGGAASLYALMPMRWDRSGALADLGLELFPDVEAERVGREVLGALELGEDVVRHEDRRVGEEV